MARRSPIRLLGVIALAVVALLAVVLAYLRVPHGPPIVEGTAFVVSPHPDDETYALGQTIYANVAAGRDVVGVLLTDGEGSAHATWWIEEHGKDLDGDGDVDRWDFGLARRDEYRAAMSALGVTELVFLGAADSQGVEGLRDGALSTGEIAPALDAVADTYGDLTFLTVARYDGADIYEGDLKEHLDHTAANAAVGALAEAHGDEAYYGKVYAYERRLWWRWAPRVVSGGDEAIAAKRAALEAYGLIGRQTTRQLWMGAAGDSNEYLVPGR